MASASGIIVYSDGLKYRPQSIEDSRRQMVFFDQRDRENDAAANAADVDRAYSEDCGP